MKRIFIFILTLVIGIGQIYSNGTGDLENDFEFNGITELEIDGRYFNIEITDHTGNITEMHIIDAARVRNKVHYELEGSKLHVWVDNYFFNVRGEPTILFEIPYQNQIDIKTSSGNIDISNIISGAADVKSSSGEIKIDGIEIETELDVSASSGNIDLSNARTAGIRINASSGDIEILNTEGNIVASSSSGNIKIDNSEQNKIISSSSGNITCINSIGNIQADSTSGEQNYNNIKGIVIAETSSGNITFNTVEGMLDLTSTSGDLKADNVLLTGDSVFQTTSGAIAVDFVNDLNDFVFYMESNSGELQIGTQYSERSITLGTGTIKIIGYSISGNITFR